MIYHMHVVEKRCAVHKYRTDPVGATGFKQGNVEQILSLNQSQ